VWYYYGHNNAFGWLLYAFHVRFLQHEALISCIRNFVHQIFQPLCAPKKHNLWCENMTVILKWVADIKMFSMLPIPNFVLPIPPTSIVVPSTIQATSRSWLKISNRGMISKRTFVYGCSCGSSVQSRVVCMILLCISKKAEFQPGWLSTSLFCVQGSTPPFPHTDFPLKCCQLNSENYK